MLNCSPLIPNKAAQSERKNVLLFDLKENRVDNLTNSHAIDGKPAWVGDEIYYLSDQGENMRLNIQRHADTSI